LFADILIIV